MRFPIWGSPQQAQSFFEDQKFWELPVDNPEVDGSENHNLTAIQTHEPAAPESPKE